MFCEANSRFRIFYKRSLLLSQSSVTVVGGGRREDSHLGVQITRSECRTRDPGHWSRTSYQRFQVHIYINSIVVYGKLERGGIAIARIEDSQSNFQNFYPVAKLKIFTNTRSMIYYMAEENSNRKLLLQVFNIYLLIK